MWQILSYFGTAYTESPSQSPSQPHLYREARFDEKFIRRLAIFGSALRSDLRPYSDIDLLVEFEPGHIPGFFGIAPLERELSTLFGGCKVDFRTPEDLSRYFRQRVIDEAEVQYARG